jgi:hypothetical protein
MTQLFSGFETLSERYSKIVCLSEAPSPPQQKMGNTQQSSRHKALMRDPLPNFHPVIS